MKKYPFKTAALLFSSAILLASSSVFADPHAGQSNNVVIIGGTTLDTNVPCGYPYYSTIKDFLLDKAYQSFWDEGESTETTVC